MADLYWAALSSRSLAYLLRIMEGLVMKGLEEGWTSQRMMRMLTLSHLCAGEIDSVLYRMLLRGLKKKQESAKVTI